MDSSVDSDASSLELQEFPDEEPEAPEQGIQAFAVETQPEEPPQDVAPGELQVKPTGVWNDLFIRLLPWMFMKVSMIRLWVNKNPPQVTNLLSNVEKRPKIIEFVDTMMEKLRMYPKPFIFFVARPKYVQERERVIVIIEKGGKLVILRQKQKLTVKGRISYFLAKTSDNFQFGMTTHLFLKFSLTDPAAELIEIIDNFVKGVEYPADFLFYKSFACYGGKIPRTEGFVDYIMSTLMTPNLELMRKWELHTWTNTEFLTNLSRYMVILCTRYHINAHVVRGLLPVYLKRIGDYHNAFEDKSFVSDMMTGIFHTITKSNSCNMVANIAAILSMDDTEVWIERIMEFLSVFEYHVQTVLIIRCIWKIALTLYPHDIDVAFYLVSKFAFYIPMRDFFTGKPEIEEKKELLMRIFLLDDTNPQPTAHLLLKRAIAGIAEAKFKYDPISGLSADQVDKSIRGLFAGFKKYNNVMLETCSVELTSDFDSPMVYSMKEAFNEIDRKKHDIPEMPIQTQLVPSKRKKWLKKHKVKEEDVWSIVIPLESILKKEETKQDGPDNQPVETVADAEKKASPVKLKKKKKGKKKGKKKSTVAGKATKQPTSDPIAPANPDEEQPKSKPVTPKQPKTTKPKTPTEVEKPTKDKDPKPAATPKQAKKPAQPNKDKDPKPAATPKQASSKKPVKAAKPKQEESYSYYSYDYSSSDNEPPKKKK